jgi:hypothetical protein
MLGIDYDQLIQLSQGRSVIDFFEQAIKAMVNPDLQEPSLIPQI